MAENKPDPEQFHYDIPSDSRDVEFDPLLANYLELSHEMTRMAGNHNTLDITDDRHLTQWDTDFKGVSCELAAWDFPDEPFYTLAVHNGGKSHIYEYGNYVQGIRYSSGQASQSEKPSQENLEARLTALLQYGHKQLLEAAYSRTFDEITGRLAVERVLETNKNARKIFNQALARKGLHAIELHVLSTKQDTDNWSVRPTVFQKAATVHLEELLDQNITLQVEQGSFRRLLEKFRPKDS